VADEGLRALAGADLVVIALPGVQRFIAEARSTGDVHGASQVFANLAARAAAVCASKGGELIFPAAHGRAGGMPNRVVALLPAGTRADAARKAGRKAQTELEKIWQDWVRQALNLPDRAEPPKTPGMPVVHWVVVSAGPGGYPSQWAMAQRLLAARRRVRDFTPALEWPERGLCSVGPRWPAEPSPDGLSQHEQDALSAAGWVKRRWRQLTDERRSGFPSTASIASAPFRKAILDRIEDQDVRRAVTDLKSAAQQVIKISAEGADVREAKVPGLPHQDNEPGKWFVSTAGPWVYPDQWQLESLAREMKVDKVRIESAAADGQKAARRLRDLMKKHKVPALASYLAVLTADLDSMGLFLGGIAAAADGSRIEVTPEAHRCVSRSIQRLAEDQRGLLEDSDLLGVPVYAGGDDLLAFVPASKALAAAEKCHDEIPLTLPRTSTAVLFFHYHAGLQGAITRARQLLEDAKRKSNGKHGLAVGYLRRSGVSEASVQPWTGSGGVNAVGLFGMFTAAQGNRLSPRLLADLDRDARELAELSSLRSDHYYAELRRLVGRHTDGERDQASAAAADIAQRLAWLGDNESSSRLERAGLDARDPGGSRPQAAARIGVFLRQEAR
jgi:hypothetical protein